MRAAVTDASGVVVNVIEVETFDFNPGPGLTLRDPAGQPVGPGWVWDSGDWIAPPVPEPVEPTPDPVTVLQEQVDALMLDSLLTGAATQDQIDGVLLATLDVAIRQDEQQTLIDELILATLG